VAIPEAQVRLFGSRARGTSRPDSDVDLLITLPDHWLTSHAGCACWKNFGANIPAIGPSETLVAPLHRHPVAEAGGAGHGAGAHPHVHEAGAFAGHGGEGAEAALLPR
jgi:hypothetical protein